MQMSEKMSKWLAQRERERDLHNLQSAIIKEHMNQTFVTVYAYLSLIKLMTHIHIDLPLLKIKVNSPILQYLVPLLIQINLLKMMSVKVHRVKYL